MIQLMIREKDNNVRVINQDSLDDFEIIDHMNEIHINDIWIAKDKSQNTGVILHISNIINSQQQVVLSGYRIYSDRETAIKIWDGAVATYSWLFSYYDLHRRIV